MLLIKMWYIPVIEVHFEQNVDENSKVCSDTNLKLFFVTISNLREVLNIR